MPYLSDSCLIDRLPVSINDVVQAAGMQFPVSLRAFLRDADCPHGECVELHLKSLQEPDRPLRTMLVSMRMVYNTANIGVRVGSREDLTGTAFAALVDLDIADCIGSVSAEQNTLFANRNGAGANDLVIYFVRSAIRTSGPNAGTGVNGCGRFPAGSPGAVVARIGSRWTLAHEVGHVLDLDHISGEDGTSGDECSTPDTSRLMTGCGTGDIVGTPTLSSDEITTMTSSPFTQIR